MIGIPYFEGAEHVCKDSFLRFGRLLPLGFGSKQAILKKIVIKRDFRVLNGQLCGFRFDSLGPVFCDL